MRDFSRLMRSFATTPATSHHDLFIVLVFFLGGSWFLWDSTYWAGLVNMGSAQYGDAAFWWNGALHFAEGIIKDNPNLDFRMGYALFAGLFVAVLGGSFLLFHKLLIAAFLFAASFLYFALKPTLGRIAAAGATALLIFNPFTAEWLAISTSDGIGLILNMTALSCFIFGLRRSLHLGFLATFGVLLATASLTRPLMSPFIAPAILILVLQGTAPWKRRIQGLAAVFAAFALPTVLWVIALHGITGSWAMAGHDSTTVYAASDPQIQVWNGAMYTRVEDSAKSRNQTQKPTADQLSKEFWLLTKDNYVLHSGYHVSRLIPHTLDIAVFSSQNTSKKDRMWQGIRLAILLATVAALVIAAIARRRWLGAGLVGVIGLLAALLPVGQTTLILAGALLLPLGLFRRKADHTYAVFVLYWWVGVAVLYLVGGTWGPPLGAAHDMNALGYRLGSQFFFVNDLITLSMLGLISTLQLPFFQSSPDLSVNTDGWEGAGAPKGGSSTGAARALSWATYFFISILAFIGVAGASVVGYRAWQKNNGVPTPFPPTQQVQTWLQANQAKLHMATPTEIVLDISDLNKKIGSTGNGGTASSYIIFNGGMSDFIWNLDRQMRSQAIVYLQNNISPFTMFPNLVYVEFPSHLNEPAWVRKQGAWVVRRLVDLPSKSNLPFYFSETSVKAFIPLSADKTRFDVSAAQIFPLQKYASQLYAAGDLKVLNGALEWDFSSGTEKYSRRFLLKRPAAGSSSESIALELDLSKMTGTRSLSFKWMLERAANNSQPLPSPTLKVVGESGAPASLDKNPDYYSGLAPKAAEAMQTVKIDLTQSRHNKLKLALDGVMPDDKIWFYEFNMQSDDFLR